MPQLPKFDIPGHAHFVTAKINRFIPLFVAHDFCRILLGNIEFYRRKHDFKLLGYVIILDHFHAVIYPQHDVPISKISQNIQGYTAKQALDRLRECPPNWDELGGLVVPPERLELARQTPARRCLQNLRVPTMADFQVTKPRTKGQKHQVWQESFYDFNVYTETKLYEKLNYIHKNPVEWRLVDDPGDYLYSSYRHYYGNEDDDLPIEIDWL
jgi:REP element-mobilizing transposase RayT